MTFYMRNYASDEKFDISKFMEYTEGVYDVLNSPFLNQLKQLPTVSYYEVNEGSREIDLIASEVYGDFSYAYLIQYYNGDVRETFPEGTKLNLFSPSDLEELYHDISTKSNLTDSSMTGDN